MLNYTTAPTRYALVSRQGVRDFRFDLACYTGLDVLSNFLKTANLKLEQRLSLCPETPKSDIVFYYEPGYLVPDSILKDVEKSLANYSGPGKETTFIRTQSGGEWACYVLIGEYEKLGDAWGDAFEQLKKDGKECDFERCAPFEIYITGGNSQIPLDQWKTEIWFPIK